MAVTHQAHNISISIESDVGEVYDFASRPENFPRWATGLAESIQAEGDHWVATTPEGEIRVRFTPPNDYGVLDHHATLPTGTEVYVPMRVVANEAGSEVIFTLFRTTGMTDEILARDMEWVRRDLGVLKELLETRADSAGE
ncbi:MAG: SRPBCC family protein [Acidimicrobiia bacterium]